MPSREEEPLIRKPPLNRRRRKYRVRSEPQGHIERILPESYRKLPEQDADGDCDSRSGW